MVLFELLYLIIYLGKLAWLKRNQSYLVLVDDSFTVFLTGERAAAPGASLAVGAPATQRAATPNNVQFAANSEYLFLWHSWFNS